MQITRISIFTNIERTMDLPITEGQWEIWNGPNPPLIQDLFSHLTEDQREFILTGATAEEWNIYCPEDDDPEDVYEYEEPPF